MKGSMKVKYKMLCDSDVYMEIALSELLHNEKVAKVIKGEFAKGLRNISVLAEENVKVQVSSTKEIYEFAADKKDFADLIELAEEDAKEHKRIRKGCAGVEIVDFTTD
jgi:antitoxin component of MazEF toxin-antitoxin module